METAVILAGGTASRLGHVTKVINKHLLPVYDKPMLVHGILLLKELGIKRIIIVLGGNSVGDIVNLLKDGSDFGIDISYIYQAKPGGISEAILLVEKNILPSFGFLVLLGDNIFDISYAPAIKEAITKWTYSNAPIWSSPLVFLKSVENPQDYGQPVFDSSGFIIDFVEKPAKPLNNFAVVGLYGFYWTVFDIIRKQRPSSRGELEITDTLKSFKQITYHKLDCFWGDCGTPEGLLKASNFLSKKE